MSHITGTASNYFELLEILRDFLCNQGHAWGLTYDGAGDGRLVGAIGTPDSVVETITCTATSDTSFDVEGTVSGPLGTATVGTPFACAVCAFTIEAGDTDFEEGDEFAFNLSPPWELLRFGGCSSDALRTASAGTASAFFNGVTNANAVSAATPFTITVQMQAATEVKAFSIWNGTAANGPSAFSLQYSDNGSDWTTAQSWSSQTWATTNQRRDYVLSSSAGEHLYWRLNVTGGTATTQITEVAFYADTGFKWACSNSFEFAFKAPGLDGAQAIHVLGRLVVNTGTGAYNIAFRGVRFWTDPDLSVVDIPGVSSDHTHPSTANAVQYWIVANGGRFILLTRISGVYEMSYCGFGLPYESPTNHPYPCIIAAPSGDSTTRLFSETTSAAYRNPCDPGNMGAEVMIPSGQWRELRNRSSASGPPDGSSGTSAYGKVWPWAATAAGDMGFMASVRDAVDGTKPILPAVILLPQDGHAWGEFDGVHYTSGFGNTAESLTRIGAIDYIAFPNVYRSANNHFAAVALD